MQDLLRQFALLVLSQNKADLRLNKQKRYINRIYEVNARSAA